MQDAVSGRVRFGVFELDRNAGELLGRGKRIILAEQPYQVLLMLVERRGKIVAREEIRKKLWPNDTVVEFDHSINAAIQKLRDALSDTSGDPRYIETLPRRGHRFIARVESIPSNGTCPGTTKTWWLRFSGQFAIGCRQK